MVKRQSSYKPANIAVGNIIPAINQATLVLANGQQLIITKSFKGKLLKQGTAKVKVTGQMISYSGTPAKDTQTNAYNTLITRRGQQAPFGLILADGTKVWLNAASSITYPVAFNGSERKVTVSGEAYFEVAHKFGRPFRVFYKNGSIEDLGTHFNVEAYDDESMVRTTLLEGSIRLSNMRHQIVLIPGQQASAAVNSDLIDVKKIDVDDAIAWRNGYFSFNHESLKSVLRKISRWYNITVQYAPGQKIEASYWGSVSCETSISVLLKRLEKTSDVKFDISGNKVFVSNK